MSDTPKSLVCLFLLFLLPGVLSCVENSECGGAGRGACVKGVCDCEIFYSPDDGCSVPWIQRFEYFKYAVIGLS